MFYILVFLFPGMISATIFHNQLNLKKNPADKLWDACIFSFFINLIVFLVVSLLFKNYGDIITPLMYSSIYLIKYMVLSCGLAVVIAFLAIYFHEVFKIKVVVKNEKK